VDSGKSGKGICCYFLIWNKLGAVRKASIAVLAIFIAGCAAQPLQKHPALTIGGIFGAAAVIIAAGQNNDDPPAQDGMQHIPSAPDCASNPKLCQ
jgi:hypothetical protein